MEEITVSMLTPGTRMEGFLLVRTAEQRVGKGGNYLDLLLVDKTGEISAKVWDGTAVPPPAGSVIKVRGLVQEFNGRLQFRVEKFRPARPDDNVDLNNLVPCAPRKPADMRREIDSTIEKMASEPLKKLVREMLRLAGDRLEWFPAAQKMHHAERSGLLHHTTDMLRAAEELLKAYPFLNGDLLRAGVILHDLAKLDEMKSDEMGNVQDYTRDGLLVGHLVRGVSTLDQAARNVDVSGEIVQLLEHMIISHHGVPEFGSPRLPMFPEAQVLHMLDTLDAKMNEMKAILDRTPPGSFSERIQSLDGRRLYHPYYSDSAE
ncbi:MAG: HD domain-containing protein [Clostridia bacterium]|nr:HD domain-containing protein [Clostridia bacterium]